MPHTPFPIAQGTLTAPSMLILWHSSNAQHLQLPSAWLAPFSMTEYCLQKHFRTWQIVAPLELCRHHFQLSARIHTHTISMLILWYFPRHSIYQVPCSHLSASQTIACMNILFQHPLDTAPHHVCTAQGTLTRCLHAFILWYSSKAQHLPSA